MAQDKKVEQITSMEDDFAQWYTDICKKAELIDYSSVKGFMILRPYGYAIWENIQRIMDGEFKKTGHENVAMPALIPESLLKKEGELVNGFAPEVAWVTMGGSDKLEERLAFRPTSETMFCDHWHSVLQTYRQLPMLYNQWCSVIRWEKTTRPFLRSREFWWQEGHTIHETAEEAMAETEQQLNCYADFCRDALAMPVVKGRKTDKEKFAGAEATYTIECMMKDRKALQSGTSHYFGDKFSRAYDVTFTGRDNKLQYPFQTSWGSTTKVGHSSGHATPWGATAGLVQLGDDGVTDSLQFLLFVLELLLVGQLVLVHPLDDLLTLVKDCLLVALADLVLEFLVIDGGFHVEGVAFQPVLGCDPLTLLLVFLLVFLGFINHTVNFILAEATWN